MTTYPAGTRGDAIRPKLAAVDVPMHGAAGAVPGTVVTAAGGANGPGSGILRQLTTLRIQWRAPGSSTFGVSSNVSAGGAFVLEDGDNPDAWVRVVVAPLFQVPGLRDSIVYMQDVYNAVGPDDVTAPEALAGLVEAWMFTLENVSGALAQGLKAWIDPLITGLEISDDGIVWVAPTTELSALVLGDVPIAGSEDLHIRRTIGAAAPSNPEVLHLIELSWEGI